ncbi:hypothetical protein [Grimontia sp. SpTr1]|uniref:hypothetical protein n=1 Tax=Grimontia sp. SpTr1 TaxID=2995319 RepID=UPI00248C6310|nr:hypothetical protein [Grimontia sp. SpTr1]
MFVIEESRITLRIALDALSLNEWSVAEWREDSIKSVDSTDAFNSVMPALALALEQADGYAFDSCCCLALQYARISSTTQQPEGLTGILSQLKIHEYKLTQSDRRTGELAKWFRVGNAI